MPKRRSCCPGGAPVQQMQPCRRGGGGGRGAAQLAGCQQWQASLIAPTSPTLYNRGLDRKALAAAALHQCATCAQRCCDLTCTRSPQPPPAPPPASPLTPALPQRPDLHPAYPPACAPTTPPLTLFISKISSFVSITSASSTPTCTHGAAPSRLSAPTRQAGRAPPAGAPAAQCGRGRERKPPCALRSMQPCVTA